jgi:hypothetical protein
MGKINIITSPSGDKMAVLPMADYERLVAAAESADDMRLYDEARRRLAFGDDEAIPSEYAKRLIAGRAPFAFGANTGACPERTWRVWPG